MEAEGRSPHFPASTEEVHFPFSWTQTSHLLITCASSEASRGTLFVQSWNNTSAAIKFSLSVPGKDFIHTVEGVYELAKQIFLYMRCSAAKLLDDFSDPPEVGGLTF